MISTDPADFTVLGGLLGDGIWGEAALSAAGAADPRGYINVHVANPVIRPLYEHNPHICLVDEPGGLVLNCSDAFWWAAGRERYFADGYFLQVGQITRPGVRHHFKLHGFIPSLHDMIVICPFSGASGATGNKTNPVEWWDELVLDYLYGVDGFRRSSVRSLGSTNDPPIAGTISVRGIALREAAKMILEARLVITVETFGCVVAGGKEVGKTLVMNSATPPSLHFTKEMESRGSRYIRNPDPKKWDMNAIAATVEEMLEDV